MKIFKYLSLFAAVAFLGLGSVQAADIPVPPADKSAASLDGSEIEVGGAIDTLTAAACKAVQMVNKSCACTSDATAANAAVIGGCLAAIGKSNSTVVSAVGTVCNVACTGNHFGIVKGTCNTPSVAQICKAICCPLDSTKVTNCMSTAKLSCS